MSSPTTPKATTANPAPCSSSPPSDEAPRPESREFTRRPPAEFGSRLANARNLSPDEAPPAPPTRLAAPVMNEDFGPSFPPLGQLAFPGGEPVTKKVLPKYGGVKGSYISPYDSGGKVPGNKWLPNSSTTVEEFEAKYGTAARLASPTEHDMRSEGSVKSDHTVEAVPERTTEEEVVPQVPEGVSAFTHHSPSSKHRSLTLSFTGSRPCSLPRSLQDHPHRVRIQEGCPPGYERAGRLALHIHA